MNKEQFKALILNQFKNPNSSIWILMYNFSHPWNSDNGLYVDHRVLKASEFNIILNVQKVNLGADQQYFNVSFSDMDKYPDVAELHSVQELRDLHHYQFFYQESIDYKDKHLIFRLDVVSLKEENYFFDTQINQFALLMYDLETRQFLDIQNTGTNLVQALIAEKRPSPFDEEYGDRYVELSTLIPDFIKILEKVDADKDKLPAQTREFVEDALIQKGEPLNVELSEMSKVIEYLKKSSK